MYSRAAIPKNNLFQNQNINQQREQNTIRESKDQAKRTVSRLSYGYKQAFAASAPYCLQ
jgi:hypothetical protein